MDPNTPGSSNPDPSQPPPGQATPREPTTPPPGGPRGPAGQPRPGQPAPAPPAPKSQSEKGPTTFQEGNAPILHGEGDPETQDAYRLGHPSEGLAQQRERLQAARAQDQGGGQPGQPNASQTQSQAGGAGTQPGQPGQPGGTRLVQMTRDEGGYTNGQTVELSADRAQQLIDSGAARAV